MTLKSSLEKTSEEPNKTSSFLDGMITVEVSTVEAFVAMTTVTTEKDETGAATTVTILEANNLATTTTRSTQSSVSLVDEIIKKITTKP